MSTLWVAHYPRYRVDLTPRFGAVSGERLTQFDPMSGKHALARSIPTVTMDMGLPLLWS